MIRLVEALRFGCLRHIRQPLDHFQVLVGPNASGKSTFLDTVGFLGDLVNGGVEKAVYDRAEAFSDLVWTRTGTSFELALELNIPEARRNMLANGKFDTVRYEVCVGLSEDTGELSILAERVLLKTFGESLSSRQRLLFPQDTTPPETILSPRTTPNTKTVVNKIPGGNDNFYDETGKGWDHAFKLGPRKSALANLPEDETKFPVSTWLKGILVDGIQKLSLNSALMRKSSPRGKPRDFRPDGSNLPWVVEGLRSRNEERHRAWVAHLQTALPDLEDVRTVEKEEDRSRYLLLCYRQGIEMPAWTASDGTLRLLALTLPAYLPDLESILLIEEPENGIHPRAIEAMFESLSSVYGSQVLMATHSNIVLSVSEPRHVLCFSRTSSGATDIILGSEHPALRDWQRDPNLGVLYAAGLLS